MYKHINMYIKMGKMYIICVNLHVSYTGLFTSNNYNIIYKVPSPF